MGTQIGELFVKIGADTKSLERGFANIDLATKKVDLNLRKTINTVAMYGAAAAAAGAAIAVYMVKKTMDAIDAQAKLARALNTSMEGLYTIQHAGELAGISTDRMNSSLERLNKSLGQAARGDLLQKEAFDRLGLSVNKLINMNADERILSITEAIKKNIPVTEQAAVSADIFGRSMGRAILELNTDAIAEAHKEVMALGLAVNEVDASKIERAGDAIYTIQQVVKGLANRLTVALAPAIEAIAVGIKDWAVESEGFKTQFETAIKWVVKAIDIAILAFNGIVVVVKLLIALGSEMQYQYMRALDAVGGAINGIIKGINQMIGWMNKYFKRDIPQMDFFSEDTQRLLVESAKESADEAWSAFNTAINKKPIQFTPMLNLGGSSGTFSRPEGGEGTGEVDEKAAQEVESKKKELKIS